MSEPEGLPLVVPQWLRDMYDSDLVYVDGIGWLRLIVSPSPEQTVMVDRINENLRSAP